VKKPLRALVFLVAALAALLLWNTYRRGPLPRAIGVAPPAGERLDEQAIAEHLAAAVRFRTVSHQDPKDDDPAIFAAFREFLESTYPKVHATMKRELVNENGLLYRWEGSDRSLSPVLFMAHQDVVPVEPGTESKWTHPPFDGDIADGFIWGRGAIDDKGSLIGLFEAFESMLSEGWSPVRSVYFASGFDEEVGGREGAKKIAEQLERENVKFAWVLDEGGTVTHGIMPGVERPVALISVAEKGYLSVELVARAEGGHSSMPPPQTSIGILASAIDRLQRHPFRPHLTTTFRQALTTLAPEMAFFQRLALSNLWLTSPFILRGFAGAQETNPLVRTTTAPTILEAGVKENVLPSTARAVVNFRVLPGDSIAEVMRHVSMVVDDERVAVTKLERTLSEPAPASSTDGPGYRILEATTHEFFPDAVVVPNTVNGATDSRHFLPIASDVYRFVPRLFGKSDLKRIHGTNERVGVAEMALEVRAYQRIVRDAVGPKR